MKPLIPTMIDEIPLSLSFESKSIQLMIDSLDMAVDLKLASDELLTDEMAHPEDFFSSPSSQHALGTIISLIFMSADNFLKSKICNIDPILLISDRHKKYNYINQEISFKEAHFNSFDTLLSIYKDKNEIPFSENTRNNLNRIKKIRNHFVHGLLTEVLSFKDVVHLIFIVAFDLWGPKTFFEKIRTTSSINNLPLQGSTQDNAFHLDYYISLFRDTIGIERTSELLGIDLKQQSYFCPNCHFIKNAYVKWSDTKTAFVQNLANDYVVIECYDCGQLYKVDLIKCGDSDCSGTLSHADTCLTCWQEF
jgi:RNase P subunit RPR2